MPTLPQPPKRRYVSRKSVLTPGEIEFHRVLMRAAPEAVIFPKVRVADIMSAAERYSGDFLRISQKHFDWIVCHPVSFEPLIAIELDDSSHQGYKQQKNDQVKNEAAAEAGIALLRFRWSRFYNEDEVRNKIAEVINRIADKQDAAASPSKTMGTPAMIANNVSAALDAQIRRQKPRS